MEPVTHEELLSIMRYEPETGKFFWSAPRPKIRVGQEVGYIKKNKGYRYCEIYGKPYSMHRLAWFYMTEKWPADQIDHINRERADNRFENLREATNGQNQANAPTRNKTGFKGVFRLHWLKENPFMANIKKGKKRYYLGCFPTAELAHEAYCKAAAELFGEFAHTGCIN